MDDKPTLLVTLVGRDRPGVTTAVFSALQGFPVEVLDIEQVVLRGRLVLGLLITLPRKHEALRTVMSSVAQGLGLDAEFEVGTGDSQPRREGRSHVTVLGAPLRPGAVAAIAGRVADTGANIDRIVRMARYPITAIEFHVSGTPPDVLRLALAAEAARQQVDVAVQHAGLQRHGMRLIVIDVDSTLVQGEVIEMLAERAGCQDEVARITELAMRETSTSPRRSAVVSPCSRGWTRRFSRRSTASSSWRPAPGHWCERSSGSATGSRSSAGASPR